MKLKELTDKNWNNYLTPFRDDYEMVIIQYINSGCHSFLESMSIGNYYLAYKHDNKYFLLTHNLITKTRVNPDYTIKVNADSRFKEFKIYGWFYSAARKAIVPVFCFDFYNRELVDNRAELCNVGSKYFLPSALKAYEKNSSYLMTLNKFIFDSIKYHFNYFPPKSHENNLFESIYQCNTISELLNYIKTCINTEYAKKGIALHEKMAAEIAESIKIVNNSDCIVSITQTDNMSWKVQPVYPYDYPEIKPELYHMINDGVMSINDALLISKNNIPIINYQQNPTLSGITVCTYFPLDKNNLPAKIFIDYVYPLDRDVNNIIKRLTKNYTLNDLFGKSSNNDLNLLFLLL